LQNEQTLKVDGQFRRRDAVEKSYPRSKKTIYGGRALFAEGVISSDVAMAEQGAARRQRAPEVERREAQRPTSLGARASQAVTSGTREWP